MQLQLITPEKALFEGAIAQAQIPGTLGDFGVLPGHAPFVSTIRPGVITLESEQGGIRKIAVVGGVAEVSPERCIVLAERALDCTDISAADAEAKRAAAQSAFDNAVNEKEQAVARDQLAVAEAILLGF